MAEVVAGHFDFAAHFVQAGAHALADAVAERFFTRGDAQIRDLRAVGLRGYQMTVIAKQAAVVESSVPSGPGWRVKGRQSAAFLRFAVPAGESIVRVTYAPRSWTISLFIAVGSILIIIFGIRIGHVPLSGVPATGSSSFKTES